MIHTAVRTLKSSLDRYLKITTFNLPMVANQLLPSFQKISNFFANVFVMRDLPFHMFKPEVRSNGLKSTGSVLLLAAWRGSVF